MISIQTNITKMAIMEKTIAIRLLPIITVLTILTTSCLQTRYVYYLSNARDKEYGKGLALLKLKRISFTTIDLMMI